MAKILLAEDEEVLRMLVVDTLEDEGHDIDEACDGEEAIEMIKQNDYDLILLDYMMPIYTGLEVIQHVRNMPDKKTCKDYDVVGKKSTSGQRARAGGRR